MKYKKGPIIILIFFLIYLCMGQQSDFAQQTGEDIVIGKYEVIHSDILDEDRLLFVHLPRNYENTQLAYPVLYLLYVDIYNYFADAAIITEKLGGTGEMPPVIIMGVANTNRYRDLLPVPGGGRSEGGGADNFLRFLAEELIPHTEKTYRTKDFRILAGPQAAAIFGLYTLITKPDLFHAVIIENPFMNPENAEYLYPKAEQFFKQTDSLKKFLYIKCEKNERPQDLKYAENFAKTLESERPKDFRFKVEFREASGYFIAPLPFREALRALFASYKLPENFETNSLEDLTNYYNARSQEYGFEVDVPELMLTFEGDKLRQRGGTTEAIEVFEYHLKMNPKSLNALFRLGESYRSLGEFEKACEYYRAFLEIQDRDAAMIHRRLSEIEKMLESSAGYRIELEIKKSGLKAGLDKFQAIRSDPQNELYFEENEFNAMGYRLMGSAQMKAALEIFKLNVELHPESSNAYDSLAEAYMKSGDANAAIKNYKKSLELNPDNNNAKEMLKKLEKK